MNSDLNAQSNQKYTRIFVVVPSNIIIIFILYFFVIYLITTFKEVFSWFSCVSLFWGALSLVLGIFFSLHFIVRYLPVKLFEEVHILRTVVPIIDYIHPKGISGGFFVIGFIVSLLFCVAVFIPAPPFSDPRQANPVVKGFYVTYIGGPSVYLGPKDTLTVRADEKLLIEIEFLNKTNAECVWTALKGTTLKTGDFSVQYIPPVGARTDTITVKVKPLCSDFPIITSLPIEVSQ
ncbi:MAG: hypothetical protein RMJ54_15000 [Roseiflexaceae bacterium]|nr:hypothetical protein [Roseiflexaceae bacterium]